MHLSDARGHVKLAAGSFTNIQVPVIFCLYLLKNILQFYTVYICTDMGKVTELRAYNLVQVFCNT